MPKWIDLSGKVALVTGASSGIGAACAVTLAEAGAEVAVNFLASSKDMETAANGLVAKIEKAGGMAFALGFDVSDSKAVLSGFEKLVERTGRLDVLVNNAGRRVDNLALRMSDAQWRECLAVNLDGAFYCIRAALALMRKGGGSIVNISSVAAYTGSAGQANYSAAKAGLVGMSNSLAIEYGSKNIRVNCVVPGLIETPMTIDLKPAYRAELISRIPLKRFGDPEEVANTVLFLASDLASYINGATLHVNGGGYPA